MFLQASVRRSNGVPNNQKVRSLTHGPLCIKSMITSDYSIRLYRKYCLVFLRTIKCSMIGTFHCLI